MQIKEEDFIDLLRFQLKRSVTNLYKNYLINVEDLVKTGKIKDEDYQLIRKKTLDSGNDLLRETEDFLEKIKNIIYNK